MSQAYQSRWIRRAVAEPLPPIFHHLQRPRAIRQDFTNLVKPPDLSEIP